MKNTKTKTIAILIALAMASGCKKKKDCPTCPNQSTVVTNPYSDPPAELPVALRQRNWKGNQGEGSCYHAAFCDVLRRQDLPFHAKAWRETYGDGEWTSSLIQKAKRQNLRVAYTTDGYEVFLRWCSDTGRAAAITWPSSTKRYGHAITFNGFRHGMFAYVTDNNNPERLKVYTKQTFLRMWRGSGGHAVTIVQTPLAPKPWLKTWRKRT